MLFRVDAGPSAGLGHLHRCLSLAAALDELGAKCIFLIEGNGIVCERVAKFGHIVEQLRDVQLRTDEDLNQVLGSAEMHKAEAIVVDSYKISARYLKQLRDGGFCVLAIDDLASYHFPCHIVVNFGPGAAQLPYESSSGDTRFLLGAKFALLQPEFWHVSQRVIRGSVRNVLLTLGGSDPHNLAPNLLHLLGAFPGDFSVTAVVGPFFSFRAEIEREARNCPRDVELADSPETIHGLTLDADLAVSASGQTLFELAATGTPTVAIQMADNQATNLQALAAKGALLSAGHWNDHTMLAHVKEALHRLMESREARMKMSTVGQQLFDGRGAQRVAMALVDECSGDNPDRTHSLV